MTSAAKGTRVSAECLPLEQHGAGFAIPIFVDPNNPAAMLVQEIDEFSGKIRGFKTLEKIEQLLVPVAEMVQASLDDDPVYAFITLHGRAYAGTALQISSVLRTFIRDNHTHKGIILQIMELIGSDPEKKRARAEMQRTILNNSGEFPARAFYEGSTLQSALWDCLVQSANDEGLARKILRVRAQISAAIDGNNNLSLNLEALTPEERARIDEDALADRILRQFDPIPTRALLNSVLVDETTHNALEVQEKVLQLLRQIKATGRQEERIAILLDAILTDRSIGLTAALQYGADRAMLANWVLNELRSKLLSDYSDRGAVERFIANLIPKLFTRHFSLSRGELLYYLAKHLAKWPQINAALQQALDRTVAIFVDNWRSEIQTFLKEGRTST